MSVLISLHASEYGELLKALKENRRALICDLPLGLRPQWFLERELNITGKEKRQFDDEELKRLIEHYRYFNDFFTKRGLLPVEKLNKTLSETSANTPEERTEQSSSSKVLFLPFSLSAEEALERVKTHLGVGKKSGKNDLL